MRKIFAAAFILLSLLACSSEQSELEKTRAELEKINEQAALEHEQWKESFGSDAIKKIIETPTKPTPNF